MKVGIIGASFAKAAFLPVAHDLFGQDEAQHRPVGAPAAHRLAEDPEASDGGELACQEEQGRDAEQPTQL